MQERFCVGSLQDTTVLKIQNKPSRVSRREIFEEKTINFGFIGPPHDTDDISSINDLISKEECSLTYVKIDNAIKVILELGRF